MIFLFPGHLLELKKAFFQKLYGAIHVYSSAENHLPMRNKSRLLSRLLSRVLQAIRRYFRWWKSVKRMTIFVSLGLAIKNRSLCFTSYHYYGYRKLIPNVCSSKQVPRILRKLRVACAPAHAGMVRDPVCSVTVSMRPWHKVFHVLGRRHHETTLAWQCVWNTGVMFSLPPNTSATIGGRGEEHDETQQWGRHASGTDPRLQKVHHLED